MQVKGVMTKEVKWVEVPGTRAEALDILRKIGASAVPVVKRGTDELVGMVRLRKLFENPSENQLAMLVDRDVSTVSINDKLEEAVNCLLKARVRRLPVLKDGKLVGMLTVQDIIYRAMEPLSRPWWRLWTSPASEPCPRSTRAATWSGSSTTRISLR